MNYSFDEKSQDRIFILRENNLLNVEEMLDGKTPSEALEEFSKFCTQYENSENTYYKILVESYGYDGGHDFNLYTYSIESDNEFKKRLKKLEQEKEKARIEKEKLRLRKAEQAKKSLKENVLSEADERALLAKLQKKYAKK